MAIPTITAITPTSGPAGGGHLVAITGTNFRQYTPPTSGNPNAPAPCYVQVLFGGEPCPRVYVYSETALEVITPAYPGDVDLETFPAMDVVLKNLDDNLVPIPGEVATRSQAYTFERENLRPPTLEDESPVTRITRAVLRMLKREVLLATSPRTHTDYSPDGVDIAQAGIPTVYLLGPDVKEDAYGWENEAIQEEQLDGTSLIWPNPIMHTLTYTVTGHSDAQPEFITLMSAIRKVFWRNPYLVMPGDVPQGSQIRLPIVVTDDPSPGAGILNANLHTFAAKLEIRRVPILYLPPYLRAWGVGTFTLGTQKLTGTLVETKTL